MDLYKVNEYADNKRKIYKKYMSITFRIMMNKEHIS